MVTEQSKRRIGLKASVEITVLLLITFVLPVIVQVDSYSTTYCCVLFIAGYSSNIFEATGLSPLVFVFPPLGLVLQAVAQSLPGIFFFVKIHGASQSRSIRRLTIGSVISSLLFAEFFPNLWAFQTFYGSPYYYTYRTIAGVFPTLSLLLLILIPILIRESSFLLHATTEPHAREKPFVQATRVASSRVARIVGLVLGVVTFIVPTTFNAYSETHTSGTSWLSTVGFGSISQSSGMISLYYYLYYYTHPITSFLLMLMLSSIRIVFARKLILYYRGIGSAYRTLAIGVVGELLVNSPFLYVYLFTPPFMIAPFMLPLPFLLVLGVVLVKLRDRLTSREPIISSSQEARTVDAWPLTFEEEGTILVRAQTVKQASVKVPLTYVVLSRIRNIRQRLQE